MGIVESTEKYWSEEGREGEDGCYRYGDEAWDVRPWVKTYAHEVCCDRWGVVERHLLVAQRCDEEDASPKMSASHYARNAGEEESEHNGVVLEVGVVD